MAIGNSLFIDRSFATKLFLALSGKQAPDISAASIARLGDIYGAIFYDSSGVSAIEGLVSAADIVKNKLTPAPYPIAQRARSLTAQIERAVRTDVLADVEFLQKAQYYNLKKGGIPRPNEEILSYLIDVFARAALLGSDLLVDPAREQVTDVVLQKLCEERAAPSDLKGLRMKTYRGFFRRIPELADLIRIEQMATVTLLDEAPSPQRSEPVPTAGEAFVFVSYARSDVAFVEKVVHALGARKVVVWNDQRLRAGNEYAMVIREKIGEAACVIVFWSATSSQSYWVRDEAELGRDLNKLIPTTIDRTLGPLGFRQIQTLDLSSWNGDPHHQRIDELVEAVHSYMESRKR